jgi:hypothetical protein
MRTRTSLVSAAIFAALAAGCGSDDEQEAGTSSATATATSVSATARLVGTYEREVTSADIERTAHLREAAAGQTKPEPGSVRLALAEGTLKMTDPRADLTILQDFSATSDGAFRIGAYQQPETGSFCGPEISQTASYRWRLSGDVLTLKAQLDECADRDSVLGGEWKRR